MGIDPISAVLDIGGKLIDRLWPDPTVAASAKLELVKLQQSGELQLIANQLDIDRVEAANPNMFISGWRPFVGWIGGLGLFYVGMGEPLLRFIATVFLNYHGAFPVIDTTVSLQVLIGMLGFGGMRTFEKVQGVASK